MPGKRITLQQEKLYMSSRSSGLTQKTSAAKAGISERSGRVIEHGRRCLPTERTWRTRRDPFAEVWESELVPMLQSHPKLLPITLLEYLQNKYDGQYGDSKLRTLERRVKQWKALYGASKEVMFRQTHQPGRQGISDFTSLKDIRITIRRKFFEHIFYHFRLSFCGWSYVKVIQGGESYTALTEGLQEALWRLGGAPWEHRTDSLSAAFKNVTQDAKEDITQRYAQFCEHYGMRATRNNPGVSHENGSIESPHGHLKRRIRQALLLRGHYDFDSLEDYQNWLNEVVKQHNRRHAEQLNLERLYLNPLPTMKTVDFTELCVRVSTSSTIDIGRVTYTVPSRLIGERLRVHLYHDRLVCYLGVTHVMQLPRVYPVHPTKRARHIDYRHIIDSLVKKPQAFRFSRLRDDLLPNDTYRHIWSSIDKRMSGKAACKFMVVLLHLAAHHDCEQALGEHVLSAIERNTPLSLVALQRRYGAPPSSVPNIEVRQHVLGAYNDLLGAHQEVCYG